MRAVVVVCGCLGGRVDAEEGEVGGQSPVEPHPCGDRCPCQAGGFLGAEVVDYFALGVEDGGQLSCGGEVVVESVLGGDEALHAGFDGGINELGLVQLGGVADGRDDGVLAAEGGEEVGMRGGVWDADDSSVGGEGGLGGGTGDDGDSEGGVGEEGLHDVVPDVVAAGAEDGDISEGG